jgi:hypothetical protein
VLVLIKYAPVAQWIEQWIPNPCAAGPIPAGGTTNIKPKNLHLNPFFRVMIFMNHWGKFYQVNTSINIPPLHYFSCFLLIGLFIYKNYGLSWDEIIPLKWNHTP